MDWELRLPNRPNKEEADVGTASLDVVVPDIYNGCWPISRAAPGPTV